ncbi:MAG: amidohydrolase family protein [Anaerolineaceae bacterium]|nr:amidohydrolase family protein [Anaerolineaceae bacterium]
MNTLLRNCKIYDGTGGAAMTGDVAIQDDRILAVGAGLPEDICGKAEAVYDLQGLSVSSGFIDAHSHNDWFAIKKDPIPYFEPFIRQGITTFVTGNCGLSTTGFEDDSPCKDELGGGLFFYKNTTGQYGTIDALFKAIDHNNPCNIAALIGHCSARASIMGMNDRPLTPAEEERMLTILEKGLEQGACGISLGLMYSPGLYAATAELKKVAELCVRYDKPMTVHPRASSKVSMAYKELFGRSHLLRALDELVEIARGTNLKLEYSHAIFVGRKSFADKDEFLRILQDLRRQGVQAGFDIYHEMMGVSVITVILPAWYQGMSMAERKKPLNRVKLAALVAASSKLLGFGFNDIEVAYLGEENKQYEGKTVHQIAKALGKSDLDAYLHLCDLSNFKGRINLSPYSTPEIISELSRDDACLYITDAWVEDYGVQNPAIYDCFPKFLMYALLGSGDTMPGTVRKMTGGTADRFSLPERGYLKPGYFADITVFNEDKLLGGVSDQGRAFGIEKVFINGRLVLDGEHLNQEALKSSGAAVRVR